MAIGPCKCWTLRHAQNVMILIKHRSDIIISLEIFYSLFSLQKKIQINPPTIYLWCGWFRVFILQTSVWMGVCIFKIYMNTSSLTRSGCNIPASSLNSHKSTRLIFYIVEQYGTEKNGNSIMQIFRSTLQTRYKVRCYFPYHGFFLFSRIKPLWIPKFSNRNFRLERKWAKAFWKTNWNDYRKVIMN